RDATLTFLNAIKSQKFESEKSLTPREIEIMKFVAEGFSNKEIARLVYSAEKTVKNQLNSIFQKLNAVNRAEAVKEAIKRNIITADLP
ncbi:MAG: LuxR C-terminal-related transcriptional regulator, partial [Elusimicrobiota bacterium]|nr:LuxR C-terminal-related transcriptional regulator [Elusimicrobiota bacterium]